MTANFYAAPSHMAGGFIVYGGYRRQRGAGVFGSFRKFMAPIGRQALSGVKAIARNKTVQDIAKKAAQKGAEVLTGVAVDALQGRDIGQSFKERSRNAALTALTGEPVTTTGPAKRAASSSIHRQSRKRKAQSAKKLKQKKNRILPAKVLLKEPPAKRRRIALSRAALNRKQLF